jgi:hypothetical protein
VPPRPRTETTNAARWDQNCKSNSSFLRARGTLRVDCAHPKSVAAWAKASIIDTALLDWRTPIGIRSLQPVLVAQQVAWGKAEPQKVEPV